MGVIVSINVLIAGQDNKDKVVVKGIKLALESALLSVRL